MRKNKIRTRSPFVTALIFLFLVALGVFMALPLVYAVMQAFKPLEELFIFPPRFFVTNPTIQNFKSLGFLISNLWIPFERYLYNTVFVSVVTTVLYLVVATLAAYPLAKHNFAGKKFINELITLALMFSSAVISLPQYIIMSKLNLIDTFGAIIFPSLASTMGIYLCINYLQTLPDSILESARIDGAGEYRIWFKIVLPNIKPAIMTVLIFQFQGSWNSTGGSFIFSENLKMLPTAVSQIASAGIARSGVGAAGSLLMMIPPILVFVLSQSRVMETMAHSGIKD